MQHEKAGGADEDGHRAPHREHPSRIVVERTALFAPNRSRKLEGPQTRLSCERRRTAVARRRRRRTGRGPSARRMTALSIALVAWCAFAAAVVVDESGWGLGAVRRSRAGRSASGGSQTSAPARRRRGVAARPRVDGRTREFVSFKNEPKRRGRFRSVSATKATERVKHRRWRGGVAAASRRRRGAVAARPRRSSSDFLPTRHAAAPRACVCFGSPPISTQATARSRGRRRSRC